MGLVAALRTSAVKTGAPKPCSAHGPSSPCAARGARHLPSYLRWWLCREAGLGRFRMLWIPASRKIQGDTYYICHNAFLICFHPGLGGLAREGPQSSLSSVPESSANERVRSREEEEARKAARR